MKKAQIALSKLIIGTMGADVNKLYSDEAMEMAEEILNAMEPSDLGLITTYIMQKHLRSADEKVLTRIEGHLKSAGL